MDWIVLTVRVLLALVFVVAGLGKAFDRRGTIAAVSDFGAPARLAAPVATLLPWAELASAAALLFDPTARLGLAGSALLLLFFMSGIAVNLARGRTPDCHCFGQIHSEPIGPSTVVRNGILIVLAGIALLLAPADPTPGPLDWLDFFSGPAHPVAALLLVGLLLMASRLWLLLDTVRLSRRLRALDLASDRHARPPAPIELRDSLRAPRPRSPRLPLGSPAPDVPYLELSGRPGSLKDLRGWDAYLVFWDGTLAECRQVVPDIVGLETRPPRSVPRVLVVVSPSVHGNQTIPVQSPVAVDVRDTLATAFGVSTRPSAVLIDSHGRVASELVEGPDAVQDLLDGSLPQVRTRGRWAGLDCEAGTHGPIPAPQLESLVEVVVQHARGAGVRSVLHLGAGNGLISAYLARALPDVLIDTYTDYPDALPIVRRNLESLGCALRVRVRAGTALAWPSPPPDLILVTAPHGTREQTLSSQMRSSALQDLESIVARVRHDAPRAALFLQIDPQIAGQASAILRGHFPPGHVDILPDFTGRHTIVAVRRPGPDDGRASRVEGGSAVSTGDRNVSLLSPVLSVRETIAGYRDLRSRVERRAHAVRLLQRPGVGDPAPSFRVRSLAGRPVTLGDILADGLPVMLLFLSPSCGPCNELMPDLARWQSEYAPALRFVPISVGSPRDAADKAREFGLESMSTTPDFSIPESFGSSGTPAAVLIHPDGTLASPLVGGPPMIRALLDRYLELLAERAGVQLRGWSESERAAARLAAPAAPGSLLPNLALPDIGGRPVRPVDLLSRETVLLFFSLECLYCREMLPDLLALQTSSHRGRDLLIVLNRAPGRAEPLPFHSIVLVDADRALALSLGIGGTPWAVPVDRRGTLLASPVAGAVPALTLLEPGSPAGRRAS